MTNTVRFRRMTDDEFKIFEERAILDYSKDLVRSGSCTEEESFNHAKDQFEDLLPDGNDSRDNYLNMIISEKDESLGILWSLKYSENTLFIADFLVYDQFRGKGYGKESLKLLETQAKELGLSKIMLHVFQFNSSAYHLYEHMGYKTVQEDDSGRHMIKEL